MTVPDLPLRKSMEPFDTMMYRSDDNPRSRSTLTGLFILDRAPDWDQLVEHYERITRLVLPLRQRIVEPPLPVTAPVWIVDPDFDLSYHLRRLRLPAPGTREQLLELLEPMTLAPFDRTRPLWEFTLIEGLEDGTAAWVTKVNHAIADGVGGVALGRVTFDLQRDPPRPEMPPLPAPEDLTPTDLLKQGAKDVPLAVAGTLARGAHWLVRLGDRVARQPVSTVQEATAYARSLHRMISGPTAPPSPLLRHRSLRRRLLVLEIPQDKLREASRAAGGSLNDGFLAAVCGALRLYHERLGSPVASLPMAMPINTRTDDDPAAGNRWAGARLAPPVDEADPAKRIQILREQVLAARNEPALMAFTALAPVVVLLPTWLLTAAMGDTIGLNDIQVSNVPGSPVPLYFAGAKVLKTFPFGPVPGPAAMITVYSYSGTCFVGVNLDRAAITDPDLFLRCLEEGVQEVLALCPGRSTKPV